MTKELMIKLCRIVRITTLIIGVLFTIITAACDSAVEPEYPAMTPKRSARFALHSKFLEAMPIRDREVLQSIMSDSAYQQVEQWFNTNSPIDCDYDDLEYKSRTFDLLMLEAPEGVQIAFEIIVPCRGAKRFSYKGNYHLVVKDVTILYTSSGWQLDSFGEITERLVKRS